MSPWHWFRLKFGWKNDEIPLCWWLFANPISFPGLFNIITLHFWGWNDVETMLIQPVFVPWKGVQSVFDAAHRILPCQDGNWEASRGCVRLWGAYLPHPKRRAIYSKKHFSVYRTYRNLLRVNSITERANKWGMLSLADISVHLISASHYLSNKYNCGGNGAVEAIWKINIICRFIIVAFLERKLLWCHISREVCR